MSAKEPEAAAVQLFDATAVSYRAAPSQRTFVALANAMPANDDRARLSEVVFEVALREGFPPLLLAHLAQAMATDDRLQEAQHFCDRWLAVEPDRVEGHRLSVIIACKRLDLDTAQAAYASLQRLEAAEEIQRLTGTLLLLSFTDGQRSAHTARTMLTEGTVRDPLGPMVAFEAAHRCEMLLHHPESADVSAAAGERLGGFHLCLPGGDVIHGCLHLDPELLGSGRVLGFLGQTVLR